MEELWKKIDKINIMAISKYRLACMLLTALAGVAGFILWLIIRLWTLSTWDWMICFIGYPVIISCFLSVLYCYNHEFHDGRYSS